MIRGRKFFYHLASWRGRWTWGLGLDRDGIGIYLGPFSGWFVWKGK